MVSEQADNLLPTLLSRMQQTIMGQPAEDELKVFLEKKFPADESRIAMAVSLCEGSVPAAIRLLEEKPDDYHPWYMDWQRACYRRDGGQILRMADDFHDMSRDLQKLVLQYSLNKTRKALVLAEGPGEILHLHENEQKELSNLGKILHAEMAEQILHHINRAWYHIDRNASARMVFFDTSMSIADAYKLKSIA
jgi:DNA polymerase-3 subunit delta'